MGPSGLEALELLDEIEQRLGIRPTPVTWPVGVAGDLQGLIDRRDPAQVIRFTRAQVVVQRPNRTLLPTATARRALGHAGGEDELRLLDSIDADYDRETFLAGNSTPVFFGSAVSNIGVRLLLDAIVEIAPAPAPRMTLEGARHPVQAPFSGLVFKVQANMNPAHRDRIAFVRVCSGMFERGMVLNHAATGRPFATKFANAMFGQNRTVVERAYPGDIVGLVNAGALRPGDTLCEGEPVRFPAMPTFAPEHFATVRTKNPSRSKQFRRGVTQLESEGVVQVLTSDYRGGHAPVLAAVGPMQFEVVLHRLEHEFGAPATIEPLPYELARRTDRQASATQSSARGRGLTRTRDDALWRCSPTNGPWIG